MQTPVHLFAERQLASFTTLFNLADPAEAFMAGWISRVHTEPPRLFKALDLKRPEELAGNPSNRLIYELALWTGRPRCYMVIACTGPNGPPIPAQMDHRFRPKWTADSGQLDPTHP